MRRLFLVVLALGFGIALRSAPAEACVPPLPGFYDVRPVDGARIPANGIMIVSGYDFTPFEAAYWDFDFQTTLPSYESDGLGFVRLDRTFSSMNPDFRTSITLEHTGELDIEPYTTTVISAPNTEPDEYSPEFQAYPTFEVDFVEDEPGSCVPGGWRVTLRFPPAVDDWGVLAYSLGADGDDGPRQLLSRLAPLDPNAEVTMVHYAGYTPRLICYALTAYDMGGNIAFLAEPRLCVTVGGDADAGVPRTDAGFEDAGFEDAGSSDAGRVDAATTPPGLALTGRSCACRGTASPSDLGGLGALLLLALAARRRR